MFLAAPYVLAWILLPWMRVPVAFGAGCCLLGFSVATPRSVARATKGIRVSTGSSEDSALDANEIGTAPPRGRPKLDRADTERTLSEIAGNEITLPAGAVDTGSPASCPACGSTNLMWGCELRAEKAREEIHPLVWHDTEWMADSFICRDCQAGWIEPDEPDVITWVRPYWRI